jgi:hypothetical protein
MAERTQGEAKQPTIRTQGRPAVAKLRLPLPSPVHDLVLGHQELSQPEDRADGRGKAGIHEGLARTG